MYIPSPPRSDETREVSRWQSYLVEALRDRQISESDSIQTTDATVTTLWKKTIEDKSVYWIEAYVVAQKSDASDRAGYLRRVLVFRNGGVATIQGSISTPETIESVAGWDATFDVSSNDVRLRVTGQASTTINWKAIVLFVHRIR